MAPENVKAFKNNEKKVIVNQDDLLIQKKLDQSAQYDQLSDVIYNSKEDFRAQGFDTWTRTHEDNCSAQNQLRVASKPLKYYVNQYNSPQSVPFSEFTVVGNQKTYSVANDYERAMPSRLNPLYPVSILPYSTTPDLGMAAPSRQYVDSSSYLRFGDNVRNFKSQNGTTEIDFARWQPNIEGTMQNAGTNSIQHNFSPDGYYNMNSQNNVLWMNSLVQNTQGISTRTLLANIVEISNC